MGLTCLLLDVSHSMFDYGFISNIIRILKYFRNMMLTGDNRCLVYFFPPHNKPELALNAVAPIRPFEELAMILESMSGRNGSNPALALRNVLASSCDNYSRVELPPRRLFLISDFEITIYKNEVNVYLAEARNLAESLGININLVAVRGENDFAGNMARFLGARIIQTDLYESINIIVNECGLISVT